MALAIEAAELMEHFQWIGSEKSREVRSDAARRKAVAEELADVIVYALALANELDLDVSDTVRAKMTRNEQKYPVELYRGRYGPEDTRPPASP
jgi:NTP pyrophosphatase (non-canonical NTP hydrolase)